MPGGIAENVYGLVCRQLYLIPFPVDSVFFRIIFFPAGVTIMPNSFLLLNTNDPPCISLISCLSRFSTSKRRLRPTHYCSKHIPPYELSPTVMLRLSTLGHNTHNYLCPTLYCNKHDSSLTTRTTALSSSLLRLSDVPWLMVHPVSYVQLPNEKSNEHSLMTEADKPIFPYFLFLDTNYRSFLLQPSNLCLNMITLANMSLANFITQEVDVYIPLSRRSVRWDLLPVYVHTEYNTYTTIHGTIVWFSDLRLPDGPLRHEVAAPESDAAPLFLLILVVNIYFILFWRKFRRGSLRCSSREWKGKHKG